MALSGAKNLACTKKKVITVQKKKILALFLHFIRLLNYESSTHKLTCMNILSASPIFLFSFKMIPCKKLQGILWVNSSFHYMSFGRESDWLKISNTSHVWKVEYRIVLRHTQNELVCFAFNFNLLALLVKFVLMQKCNRINPFITFLFQIWFVHRVNSYCMSVEMF